MLNLIFDLQRYIHTYILTIMPYIVSIEGNIGSGKSTFLRSLQQHARDTITDYEIECIQEPVDEWNQIKDSSGESILEKFYANQKEYAFSFQIMAYITRLRKLIHAVKHRPNCVYVCERSLETDKYVFAKMLYDSKKIREIDWIIYNHWFNTFVDTFKTNLIIYINTTPNNCHARIQSRNRKGEETIPLDYLQTCHEYHTSWIQHTDTHTETFDGNIDIRSQDKYVELIQSVSQCIRTNMH